MMHARKSRKGKQRRKTLDSIPISLYSIVLVGHFINYCGDGQREVCHI